MGLVNAYLSVKGAAALPIFLPGIDRRFLERRPGSTFPFPIMVKFYLKRVVAPAYKTSMHSPFFSMPLHGANATLFLSSIQPPVK